MPGQYGGGKKMPAKKKTMKRGSGAKKQLPAALKKIIAKKKGKK